MASIEAEFGHLFDDVRRQGRTLRGVARAAHIMGSCEILLDTRTGWLEAHQRMGWTDFDTVRPALEEAVSQRGAELLEPGPDGVSQPVLRIRTIAAGCLRKAWLRLAPALADADEVLRRWG